MNTLAADDSSKYEEMMKFLVRGDLATDLRRLLNKRLERADAFEGFARKITQDEPMTSSHVLLRRVDACLDGGLPVTALSSNREIALWILDQEDIMELIENHKKINAIKEVRMLMNLSLYDAKTAVELAIDLRQRGHMTSREKAQLAQEEADAIRSILGN